MHHVYLYEKESVHHLFFDCVVARSIWSGISEVLGFSIGCNFGPSAVFWLSNIKNLVTNMATSAVESLEAEK
uniref:Reverse transcriptase zinc-binding domain-containing protein n=1 Tax=Arundo donax TaxID=35708 RepID=A0A0A9FXE4_ARUDO